MGQALWVYWNQIVQPHRRDVFQHLVPRPPSPDVAVQKLRVCESETLRPVFRGIGSEEEEEEEEGLEEEEEGGDEARRFQATGQLHVQHPTEISLSTSTISKNAPNATEPTMATLTRALMDMELSSMNLFSFDLADCYVRGEAGWGREGRGGRLADVCRKEEKKRNASFGTFGKTKIRHRDKTTIAMSKRARDAPPWSRRR
jgi:hypothetical protein